MRAKPVRQDLKAGHRRGAPRLGRVAAENSSKGFNRFPRFLNLTISTFVASGAGVSKNFSSLNRLKISKFRSLLTRTLVSTSPTKTRSSKLSALADIPVNRICGDGIANTSGFALAIAIKTSRTLSASAAAASVRGITTRPDRSLRTRLVTTPETRFEFGMMTWARSKVSISLERTLMRRSARIPGRLRPRSNRQP